MKRYAKAVLVGCLLVTTSAAMAASSFPANLGDMGAPLTPISTAAEMRPGSIVQSTTSPFPPGGETYARFAPADTRAAEQAYTGNSSSSAFPASAEDNARFATRDTAAAQWARMEHSAAVGD